MKRVILVVIMMGIAAGSSGQDLPGMTRMEAIRAVMDYYGMSPIEPYPTNYAIFSDDCAHWLFIWRNREANSKTEIERFYAKRKLKEAILDCHYLLQAFELGITAGCGGKGPWVSFCADDPITDLQLQIFIQQAEALQ